MPQQENSLLESIPLLPDRNQPWPPNIVRAYQIIESSYTRAFQLLRQADLDPLRMKVHIDTLADDVCPLLVALAQIADTEAPLGDWLVASAEAVGKLGRRLKEMHETASGRCVAFSTQLQSSNGSSLLH